MPHFTTLDKSDIELVNKAEQFVLERYEPNVHHVACVLRCKDKLYYSLHLDIEGFDICAEPIALSNALTEKQTQFDTIVSVLWTDKGAKVISPCGNCRQMLFRYAPNVEVVVNTNRQLKKIKATKLLPIPYSHI